LDPSMGIDNQGSVVGPGTAKTVHEVCYALHVVINV
jgi:hypothetical protein